MGTYGSRSGAVGMSAVSKALDKVEAKAKKIAAHLMEAAEATSTSRTASFSVKGTDKTDAVSADGAAAYTAHKFLPSGAWSRA
jgi:carbon-monoxide dehydrogenase large subunit